MLEFEYPWAFILVLLFIVCALKCKVKNATIYMSMFQAKDETIGISYITQTLKWLGIILLIVSIASPITKSAKPSTRPAHAVVLLMDTSESMVKKSRGFFGGPSRSDKFDKAKKIASSYIEQREGDHIGIVVFGDFAYVASPLSFDTKTSAAILRRLEQGVAGNKTAMYDALFLSTRLLKDSPAKEKAVILLTDGYNTSGKIPLEASMRAIQSENLKVFTIGIGVEGEFDKNVLQHIAKNSGGVFFHSLKADDLDSIYKQIDQLQKSDLSEKERFDINYLFMYPLLFSITFLTLYLLVSKGRQI